MNNQQFQDRPYHSLTPFPDANASALQDLYQIKAQTHVDPKGLNVRFHLQGKLHFVETPLPASIASFRDGLWKASCFEVFVAHVGMNAYLEVNASSSGDWAAYAFSSYRNRDSGISFIDRSVRVSVSSEFSSHNHLKLEVAIPQQILAEALPNFNVANLRLGLATVLEDRQHHLSYWALAHKADKADFHEQSSFILAAASGKA